MPALSRMSRWLGEAVAAQRELNALPPRRLTGSALVAAAMREAECDASALDDLERQLAGAPEVAAFVRRVAALVEDGLVREPVPARKHGRWLHAYGASSSIEAELLRCKSTPGIALALAMRKAVARMRGAPDGVADLEKHDNLRKRASETLDHAIERMRATVSGIDIELDQSTLTTAERDRGLALAVFKIAPTVVYAADWPRRLVAAVIAAEDAAGHVDAALEAESEVDLTEPPAPKPARRARPRPGAEAA